MTTRALIDDFLARKRFAMVGVSRQANDFSRTLFRAFCQRGYEVLPVNPGASEMEGRPCYARIQDAPNIDAVLLMTPPKLSEAAVRQCAEAGVRTVWFYRAVGCGALSPEAVTFCESKGIQVIAGYCPLMFLPGAEFYHRLHGFFLKLVGRYPA